MFEKWSLSFLYSLKSISRKRVSGDLGRLREITVDVDHDYIFGGRLSDSFILDDLATVAVNVLGNCPELAPCDLRGLEFGVNIFSYQLAEPSGDVWSRSYVVHDNCCAEVARSVGGPLRVYADSRWHDVNSFGFRGRHARVNELFRPHLFGCLSSPRLSDVLDADLARSRWSAHGVRVPKSADVGGK